MSSTRRRGNAPRKQHRTPAVVGAVIAAVLLLAIAAVVATSGDEDTDSGVEVSQVRPVDVAGAALPLASDTADPAVGRTIPKVTGRDFAGQPVTIDPANGQAKVLIFVAHWCPHCQSEVPVLAPELRRGLPDGVEAITVSTRVDEGLPNYPPSKWLDREGWPVTVLADDAASTAMQAYGVGGFPYFTFVDRSGRVVVRASGELTVDRFRAGVAMVAPS